MLIADIAAKTGLPKILAELVVARGYDTAEKAAAFLTPDPSALSSPYSLAGTEDAVRLIEKHSANGKILVFGDYDCDGIGASAILSIALREHGADAEVFIPTRTEDGYGLSEYALKRAYDKYKPTLLVTVDCGIGSIGEIRLAHELGMETVVTDHHEPMATLPDSVIINPKTQTDAEELCGAGVAFMLVRALYGDEYAMRFIDICAVSTIADLVPLTGDNRIIAACGLKALSSGKVRYGLKALLEIAGHKRGYPVKSGDVAFKLAPRLNASGRLSTAEKSYRLLTTDDKATVDMLAAELDRENKERQDLCNKTIAEARRMLLEYDLTHNRIIVLHNDGWEGGVVGIAAAKIAEEFSRPTVLFVTQNDVLKGSCRSIKGVNIYEVLAAAKEAIIQFGGHTMAAGLSVRPEELERFTAIANAYIKATYTDEYFLPSYDYDAELAVSDLTTDFATKLELLEPFGMGNPRPVFKTAFRRMLFERIKTHAHIKSKLNAVSELVAFNELGNKEILNSPMLKNVFYTVDKEEFRGRETLRCVYRGMQIVEAVPPDAEIIARAAAAFIPKRELKRVSRAYCGYDETFGRLLIAFTPATFAALRREYPSYLVATGQLVGDNPYNTILIAPARDNFYGYYSVIEVFDTPPAAFVSDLKAEYSAEIIVHNNAPEYASESMPLDRDKLLGLFSFIKAYAKDRNFTNIHDVYYTLSLKGYSAAFPVFETGYCILTEIGVIFIDKDNYLRVNAGKKDLSESKILKLIHNAKR